MTIYFEHSFEYSLEFNSDVVEDRENFVGCFVISLLDLLKVFSSMRFHSLEVSDFLQI